MQKLLNHPKQQKPLMPKPKMPPKLRTRPLDQQIRQPLRRRMLVLMPQKQRVRLRKPFRRQKLLMPKPLKALRLPKKEVQQVPRKKVLKPVKLPKTLMLKPIKPHTSLRSLIPELLKLSKPQKPLKPRNIQKFKLQKPQKLRPQKLKTRPPLMQLMLGPKQKLKLRQRLTLKLKHQQVSQMPLRPQKQRELSGKLKPAGKK